MTEPPPSAAWNSPPPGMPGATVGATASLGTPRRRVWLVVLISVMAAIVLVAIAGTVLFVDRTLPPYNGAHDFLDDVVHGRATSAADGLCADDRDDPESALALVVRNFSGGKTVSVNALGVDRSGDEATVEYSISRQDGGTARSFTLPVRLEDGAWRACPSA